MSTHNVIEIPLEDLARDPVLPPRIMDEERLGALCRSMTESGMAEPLVVRPALEPVADGPKYLTVLGYRRQLAAGRLGWEMVPAVVRGDLDDAGVLQLAFEADNTTESRTALENCWLRIPVHSGRPFRWKPATDSGPFRPLIPAEAGHPFR